MDLLDVMQDICQQSIRASSPTELTTGVVTAADPLEITSQTSMQPLRAPVLWLTAAVVEKKIPVLTHKHRIETLSHTHTAPEGTTGEALTGSYLGEESLASEGFDGALQAQDIVCWEDGKPLPVEDGFIILNRKLEVGDKVLLLRVLKGQAFVVLSRIFEQGGGA